MPFQILAALLPKKLPTNDLEKTVEDGQCAWILPLMWAIRMKHLSLGFALAQLVIMGIGGVNQQIENNLSLSLLSLSLFLCLILSLAHSFILCSSVFQINE